MPRKPIPKAGVYVALSSGILRIKGVEHRYFRGRPYSADDAVVRAMPQRFKVFQLDGDAARATIPEVEA